MAAVPEGIDPAEAVCLVLNYVTAWQLMHRAATVIEGSRVLVHAAAGGVGTAVLELGRIAGAEVYGTASRGKHAVIAALDGIAIDYRSEDFAMLCDPQGGCWSTGFLPRSGAGVRIEPLRSGARASEIHSRSKIGELLRHHQHEEATSGLVSGGSCGLA